MVSFKETSVSRKQIQFWNLKELHLFQGDKMFKVFSRPQIDLEDILKFDKVQAYVAEKMI
jgi:tRNA uridine 5-carboxymethylaminomethyl modification enzyme